MIRVPLASSGLRKKDIDEVIRVLNSGQLTMGPVVHEFEDAMSNYLGLKHFVMTNSGSSANLLMVESLLRPTKSSPKVHHGDAFLVPAIAWPTTVWPIIQLGLRPIFVDIDPETLGIDLQIVESLVHEADGAVRGIFPIHPLGLALDPIKLQSIADMFELSLINDVCESLGSWRHNLHAGAVGHASSYSFYFSHHITTMEGGGVATNDDQVADDLRSMRSHGWSRDRSDASEWHRKTTYNDSRFLFVSTGYNVRPMEIQAAIGLVQLQDLDKFVQRRRNIVETVQSVLKGSDIRLIGYDIAQVHSGAHSWMLMPLQITGKHASRRKERIIQYLNENLIETRPILTGNFLAQPAVRRITRDLVSPDQFPNATHISQSSFMTSCHHDLNDLQVEHLARSLEVCTRM